MTGALTDDEPLLYATRRGAVEALMGRLDPRSTYGSRRGSDPATGAEPFATAIAAFMDGAWDAVSLDDLTRRTAAVSLTELEVCP